MSRINRDFFFEHLHERLYPKGLSQSVVDGHEGVLDEWEANHATSDDRWLAYMLATAYHETARTLQPVRETLATTDDEAAARLEKAWKSGKLAWVKTPYWRKDENGQYWFGRGLVQLTFEANYRKLGKDIGINLAGNPSLALQDGPAIKILFYGMLNGEFTGKKLANYFAAGLQDWINARRIINGLDRAADIAGYGKTYYAAISYTK